MPSPHFISLHRSDNRALRNFGRGLVTPCDADRDVPFCRLSNASRRCQGLTGSIGSSRPRVQRLNISRRSNELVQDRFAGDNV